MMEEVDRHILQTCHSLDCSFSENEGCVIADLSTDDCIEFLIRALWKIDPSTRNDLPTVKLPQQITTRFRTATNVATLLKKNNIHGEIGYQTLLYGSVSDLRKVFIATIEKLPKENTATDDHGESALVNLIDSAKPSETLWVPEFCRRLRLKHDGRFWCPGENEADIFRFGSTHEDLWKAVETYESRSWMAHLISINSGGHNIRSTSSISKPELAPKPRIKPSLPPKPVYLSSENNEAEARELEQKHQKLEELLAAQENKRAQIVQNHTRKVEDQKKIESIKTDLACENINFLTLLDDPMAGKERLLNFLSESNARVSELDNKWAEARIEKAQELDIAREELGIGADVMQLQTLLAEKKLRLQELRENKEQNIAADSKLASRLKRLGEDQVNRAGVTRRIMEMTASIAKQKEQIDATMQNIASVQKELKWLTQNLSRTHLIIEDALFKDTSTHKGERAYRIFGRTFFLCEDSIASIEKNGAIARANEAVIDQIELEKQKNTEVQLCRLEMDLDVIRKENIQLEQSIPTH